MLGKSVSLAARWSVVEPGDEGLLATDLVEHHLPLEHPGHAAFVSGLNRIVLDLSHDIARGLHQAARATRTVDHEEAP